MSTRSHIGFIKGNQITYIYCHFDGYPEYNGRILQEYYTNREKIKELLNLGDISCLNKELSPKEGEEHSFDGKQAEGVVVAYHRDRGEVWQDVMPRIVTIDNFDEIWNTDFIQGRCAEYSYLYNMNVEPFGKIQPGKWGFMWQDNQNNFRDLETEYNKHNGWE